MAAVFVVRGLLKDTLEAAGLTALEYRTAEDAVQAEELDCVLISEGESTIEYFEGQAGGTVYHRTRFFLEFMARATKTQTKREAAYELFTTGINALMADYTLGGQVENLLPVTYGGEEDDGKDFASVLLDLDVLFATGTADWATLLT